MISDSNQNMKPIPCFPYLNVNSVYETYQKALKAGAKSTREPTDEFYGNRGDCISDFAGNHCISLLIKKTSQEMNSKD